MSERVKDGSGRITARRRLIRGAFAAPAALTLCSGSAFAAASSSLRSIARQVNDPRYPAIESNPTDTWVRVPVYKSGETLLVKRAHVDYLQGKTLVHLQKKYTSGWAMVANLHEDFSEPKSQPAKTGQYAALLVDVEGVIVGISTGSPSYGSSAVTMSSWASFSGVEFWA